MEEQGLVERVKVGYQDITRLEYGGLAHNGIWGAFRKVFERRLNERAFFSSFQSDSPN
jgi:hypothetical protein